MAVRHKHVHLPVEKREQKGANVLSIDIGIRHDDDAVVAQALTDIRILFFISDINTDRGNKGDNFVIV